MVDSVYDNSLMNSRSFAKEKTSKDKHGLKRKKRRINKWNNVPLFLIEPIILQLQHDNLNTDACLIQAWIVGYDPCNLNRICSVSTTLWNCSLDQNLTYVQVIFFDNFFKVAPVYACLLLWITNAISQICIINTTTYPKHSQVHLCKLKYHTWHFLVWEVRTCFLVLVEQHLRHIPSRAVLLLVYLHRK